MLDLRAIYIKELKVLAIKVCFPNPSLLQQVSRRAQFLAQCYLLCMLMTCQMLYVTAAY